MFSLVAVLALGMGIGANTAIFSVVDAVLLHPLGYPDSARLVMIWERNKGGADRNMVSPLNFLAWRERSRAFEHIGALHVLPTNLAGEAGAEQVWGLRASAALFPALGMKPLLGRGVLSGEDRVPPVPVGVLTYGLWQRRFGGRTDVIGQPMTVNNTVLTIVGVMPPDFELPPLFGGHAELIMPISFSETVLRRSARFLGVVARLRSGWTIEQARAEMDAIAAQMAREAPERNAGWGVNIVPFGEQLTGEVRPAILVLLAAVGCVLLIACANVANLLLARAAGRRREIAIRAALGAERGRILRQLLTESLLLGMLGGGVGILLAFWAMRGLASLRAGVSIPRLAGAGINGEVLAFTLLLSIATGVLFGLAPALTGVRTDLVSTLKSGGRASAAGSGRGFRNALVVVEIALALTLLAGAALMLRTFAGLQRVELGIRPANLLTMRILLTPLRYMEERPRIVFYRGALDRLRALPGVESAAAINFLPFTGVRSTTTYAILGRPAPPPEAKPVADVRIVTPDYFRTMGIGLVRGRVLTEQDGAEAPVAFLISESMARRMFGNGNPLGQRLRVDTTYGHTGEIVGVVRDVRHREPREDPEDAVYMPYAQNPMPFASLVVRTTSDPSGMAAAAARAIAELDREQPVTDVRTMDDIVSAATARTRYSMLLLAAFAAAAAALAAIGIYGVMSYAVAQQTQEFGVRMALGAERADVLRQVMAQALRLASLGLLLGIAGALALARAMSSLLFGVGFADPLTLAAVAGLLCLVAVAAAWLPALRASRVDPSVALREE